MAEKIYSEMTDAELAKEKSKLETHRDSLKEELRKIVAEQDKRIMAKRVSTMTDAEKETMRQVIGK